MSRREPPRHERRAFLGGMAGAFAAELACSRPLRPVPGALLGPPIGLGHRLREGGPPYGEPSRTERHAVVIVGAGPSGLAAAWRLARRGERDFVVLELDEREGGTSRYGETGVVAHPWGAHYLPLPRRDNTELVALLREMGALEDGGVGAAGGGVGAAGGGRGVGAAGRGGAAGGAGASEGEPVGREEQLVRDPEERVFYEGSWHEGLPPRSALGPADEAELEAFRREIDALASLRDGRGRRGFDSPLDRSSDDAEFRALDRITMADWLASKGLGRGRWLRWWVDYACRDDYGLRLEDTSAWAGLFYFASRVATPGVGAAPLLAWPEGNGRLVRHLASALPPGALRTGALALDVATGPDRAEVLALDAARGELVRYEAERVVFALPKFLAPRVLRHVREARPAWPAAFRYGAWMVANVHLREHPEGPGAPIAWDNVFYDSPSLGYVVATHQAHLDAGPTVLTHYYPYVDRDPNVGRRRLFDADHRALSDAVLADLRPAHRGLDRLVERVDVWRWGHAMVQPRPGFVWGPERAEARRPFGRVHMAHNDLSGMALFEEAFAQGIRAADEALAALRTGD
nr:NAD(P)-binding protein [Polyangiaceae bacterium]